MKALHPAETTALVRYHNGPVLAEVPGRATRLQPLAYFSTEKVAKGGAKGLMIGSPAIATAQYGKGQVIGISPHPEQTPGLKNLVPAAIRWMRQG
jgi:hypothetical protein